MRIIMEFKDLRVESEYSQLRGKNIKLFTLLECLDKFSNMELGRGITVTCIYRTPEENDELYKETPANLRPKTSPHLVWHGADVRTSDHDDAQVKKMLAFCNLWTYASGQGRPAGVYEKVLGNVMHLHVQCD